MNLQTQIVTDFAGLLSLVVTAGVAYFTPKIKAVIASHFTAQQAQVANHVIDGLGKIAQSVVQDFNQTVVADAKANGAWTPKFAQQVKQDAINAVKSQGASLITLGQSTLGNIDGLISSLIEQAVTKAKA